MRVVAIVPQQRLSIAKSRLAPVLDPRARATLSLALLRRVCGVLREVPAVEAITIMTPDPMVQQHAAWWGILSQPDPAPGLNAALAEATAQVALSGTAARVPLAKMAARARLMQTAARGSDSGGRRGVLVIAADLPHLSVSDVVTLVGAAGAQTLVLAPSKDGTGTNALVAPPGVPFRPAYGVGSRSAHHREADRAGLRPVEIYRPGLAFDIDLPEDLAGAGYSQG